MLAKNCIFTQLFPVWGRCHVTNVKIIKKKKLAEDLILNLIYKAAQIVDF